MIEDLDLEVFKFIYIHKFGGRAEVIKHDGISYVIKLLDYDEEKLTQLRISKREFDEEFSKYAVKELSLEEKLEDLKNINKHFEKIMEFHTKELNTLRKENEELKSIIKDKRMERTI